MYWEEPGYKASLNQLSLMHAPSLWLTDVPCQEGRPKVVEVLCDFIATIFRWSSAQKIVFENEVAVRGILGSLQSLLVGDVLKKVLIGMHTNMYSGRLEFWKGGFQYVIKAHVGHLLRGLGGAPHPPGKFWISDLLRSFLVYSWGEIAKAGRLTAKPGCCVWSPQN